MTIRTNSTNTAASVSVSNSNPLHVISHAGGVSNPTEKPKPGGVVSFVGGLFYNPALENNIALWFLDKADLFLKRQDHQGTVDIEQIEDQLFQDHYGFANETPWFALHQLWNYITPSQAKFAQYRRFQQKVAHLVAANTPEDAPNYMVNDYQMALLPAMLRQLKPNARISLFWHIPFMPDVPANMPRILSSMKTMVTGMLGATTIGFHTTDYRENFFQFVEKHFGVEYIIDRNRNSIFNRQTRAFVTQIVVAPLGIDYAKWSSDTNADPLPIVNENVNLEGRNFAITVGRCEPIKGILEQLFAIKRFFEKYGHDSAHGKGWIGRFSFVLVAQRTRANLKGYDQYFFACQALHELINSTLKTTTWAPVYWLTEPFTPNQLKALFRKSKLYVGNSLADGLNLAVIEWMAANQGQGIPLVSAQTGAHELLMDYAVTIDPYNVEALADSIHSALTTDKSTRKAMCAAAHDHLKNRTMVSWWNDFGTAAGYIESDELAIA